MAVEVKIQQLVIPSVNNTIVTDKSFIVFSKFRFPVSFLSSEALLNNVDNTYIIIDLFINNVLIGTQVFEKDTPSYNLSGVIQLTNLLDTVGKVGDVSKIGNLIELKIFASDDGIKKSAFETNFSFTLSSRNTLNIPISRALNYLIPVRNSVKQYGLNIANNLAYGIKTLNGKLYGFYSNVFKNFTIPVLETSSFTLTTNFKIISKIKCSLLEIKDLTNYEESSRTNYNHYVFVAKYEKNKILKYQLLTGNINNALIWETNSSNGVYSILILTTLSGLNLNVTSDNVLSFLSLDGVNHKYYTIPVACNLLACLEDFNEREVKKIEENKINNVNDYINIKSMYLGMIHSASKNDLNTTSELFEIIKNRCIKCKCRC